MRNYCISYQLFYVGSDGYEYPVRRAFTRSTLLRYAKNLNLHSYCIITFHTENFVSTVVKKDYFNA